MPGRQEVQAFIQATFRSVWTLELLCFLRRHRDSAHSNDALVQALRASDLVVSKSLDELVAAGLVLVEEEEKLRYSPASADLDKLVQKTDELYNRSPDAVRRLIVSASSPGITAFAEAFRLRKE